MLPLRESKGSNGSFGFRILLRVLPISHLTGLFVAYLNKQDMGDARDMAKNLESRSLLQMRENGYIVPEPVLAFMKDEIRNHESINDNATSRQRQYLGRLDVLHAYADGGHSISEIGGLYALIALWRSLEALCEEYSKGLRYQQSLNELEKADITVETYDAVARLLLLEVGLILCSDFSELFFSLLGCPLRLVLSHARSELSHLPGKCCQLLLNLVHNSKGLHDATSLATSTTAGRFRD